MAHLGGNAWCYKTQVEKMDELIPVSGNLNVEFPDKLPAVWNKTDLINQETGLL